ncbi:MAG: hypothetical protein RIQ81_2066 [Pseudomonadota bacterium]
MCYSPMVEKSLKVLEHDFGVAPVRESFEEYRRLHDQDPKKFPDFSREQIFPGHFAPVATTAGIEPMRYSAWPSAKVTDPSRYTTYNARIENLGSPFWMECPDVAPGVVKVKAFLEWVEVADLLKDGKVSLEEIEAAFAEKSAARRDAMEHAGKKYRPTPTEKKPARERKVTIMISPEGGREIFVPVLVSRHAKGDGFVGPRGGFAIITGPAPKEILRAGHDRCPLHLPRMAAMAWLAAGKIDLRLLGRPGHEVGQDHMNFTYRLEA